MEKSNEKALKIIEQQYASFIDQKDDWGFFRGLAEYTKTLEAMMPTKALVEALQTQADFERKVFEALNTKAMQELTASAEKIAKVAEGYTKQYEPIARALREVENRMKGLVISSNPLHSFNTDLFDVARSLKESGHGEVIKAFEYKDKKVKNIYGDYTFSKTYENIYREEERLERKEEIEPWGAWEKLPLVKKVVFNADELNKEAVADLRNEHFYSNLKDEDVVHLGVQEIDLIRLGKIDAENAIFFNISKYKDYARRVHIYITTELIKSDDEQSEPAPNKTSEKKTVLRMEKSNEKIIGALERRAQLIRDSRNTKLYYKAVMDYHVYIGGSKELTLILRELISEDEITPYYLQEIFNDFLISQSLKFYVPAPNEYTYPNFYTAEINQRYKLMKKFAELMQSEYDEDKDPNKVYLNPNAPVIKTLRDDDFFLTQKLHNDIIEKLEVEKPDPLKMIEHLEGLNKNKLDFDVATSTLSFLGEAITISARVQSDAHDLLSTLFKDRNKEWQVYEVVEDWGFHEDEDVPKNKVYQAGKAVNRIVAQHTKVKDFLIVNTKTVAINKAYLE